MNGQEKELLENLRKLAAQGPRQAPARVERRLLAEFGMRQGRHRRNLIWWPAGCAIAAGVALLLWLHVQPSKASRIVEAPQLEAVAAEESNASFYPLPEADALPPVENAMVVRVQVPLSSLRLMGYPVDEDGRGTAVQADLLLGQDGLARGVRLVQ